MLQELSVKNLALIENLELQFNSGFTTLTGETGAGKSILLDALGLTLGERADSSLVRHNTTKADVTALFDLSQLPHIQQWLTDQDLEDEDQCYLRRTLTNEGRSKAYINGIPVPAGQLKTLGSLLIDIHGQHEHQNLLSSHKQIHLLDAYAQHPALIKDTAQKYQDWQKIQQRLTQLENDQADFQSKLELLTFQQKEFEEVNPQADEFEQLSNEQAQLSHANEIKQACEYAYASLENEQGAVSAVNQAIQQLEAVLDFSPALKGSIDQLQSSLIELQESSSEIHQHAEHIDLDPQQLLQTEERLSALFGLAKKYNIEADDLVEKHQQINQDLAQLEQSDASLEQLKQALDQAWNDFLASAETLKVSRKAAAIKLSEIITQGMHTLGMENGVFEVNINDLQTPSSSGLDKVEFFVTANKGQPPQPLAKVASGGELSRISLAIQVATSEVASLPTLIFDEVDVGIGGGVAEVVGEKMRTLGLNKQVLSITHLAQVASHGHHHFSIQKHSDGEVTKTELMTLEDNQRVEELARMLGGKDLTEQTRKHAEEMLRTAQEKGSSSY